MPEGSILEQINIDENLSELTQQEINDFLDGKISDVKPTDENLILLQKDLNDNQKTKLEKSFIGSLSLAYQQIIKKTDIQRTTQEKKILQFVENIGLKKKISEKVYTSQYLKPKIQDSKPNLNTVENDRANINIEYKNMIDRAKSKYANEYTTLIREKQKEYAEKPEGEAKDYIKYDGILRAISKYAKELDQENNNLLQQNGFYQKSTIVDRNGIESTGEIYGGREYFSCSRFFDFLNQNQYEGYTKDGDLINKYNTAIQKLFKSTGYDKANRFEKDTKAYKNYNKELEKESQRLNYSQSLKYLSEHPQPEDQSKVEEYMKHVNVTMEYSTFYDTISKKYGPKRIAGYEITIKEINKIQKKYPGFTDAMARTTEYNVKLNNKKQELNIDDQSIAKYTKYIHAITSSGINTRYDRLGILEKKLEEDVHGTSDNTYIFPHVRKKLAEQKKSQEETDKIRSYIKKVPVYYDIANFLVGAWNGISDALIGTGAGLGILIMSIYKDEYELKSQMDRKDKWTNFLKIGQSTAQKEPPVTHGKYNLNFDNTLALLGSQTVNMLILLSCAGALGRGLASGGSKLGLAVSEVAANKSGLVTYAMMQGLGSSFGEGLKSGLSKSEAWNYALVQSVVSSSLELVAPNKMFFGTANIGKVLKQLSSPQARGQVLKQFIKNISKEMGEEILQENAQLVAERGINAITNNVYDTMMDSNISLADLTTTAVLTGLTTGLVSSKGSYDMAKMETSSNAATKKWIVSDKIRYNDFKNKLNEVVSGKSNIIAVDQAKSLLVELVELNSLGGERLNELRKKKTSGEKSVEIEKKTTKKADKEVEDKSLESLQTNSKLQEIWKHKEVEELQQEPLPGTGKNFNIKNINVSDLKVNNPEKYKELSHEVDIKIDQLEVIAMENLLIATKVINGIGQNSDALSILIAPLKDKPRMKDKIMTEKNAETEKLNDIVRSTILYSTVNQIRVGFKTLIEHPEIKTFMFKNRLDDSESFHSLCRDMLINVELKNGFVFEIQLHIPEILKIKDPELFFFSEGKKLLGEGKYLMTKEIYDFESPGNGWTKIDQTILSGLKTYKVNEIRNSESLTGKYKTKDSEKWENKKFIEEGEGIAAHDLYDVLRELPTNIKDFNKSEWLLREGVTFEDIQILSKKIQTIQKNINDYAIDLYNKRTNKIYDPKTFIL